MATTTELRTADDLLEMGSDARFKLWEGVLKEVSPSSVKTGLIRTRLLTAINVHVETHGLGYVTDSETGFILSSNPHTVVAPDIGFFRPERYPADYPERGFFPMSPDLAIGVISPTDERADIKKKQQLYTRAGVPLVWWVDPEARTVTVYRLGARPDVLDESMMLDGENVVPGFSMPVERIFAVKRAMPRS